MNRLLAHSVAAFLALPGMVAFVLPLLLVAPTDRRIADATGAVPLALGIILLLWCVREFYAAGRGTLAPWAPPRHLVVTGLYRFSRNPMYVSVLLIIVGWALLFRSRALALYALILLPTFMVRVIFYEEPFLAERHGDEWVRYKGRVPRWLGKPRR